MTKKDFILIVKSLKESRDSCRTAHDRAIVAGVVRRLADDFEKDNISFNKTQFIAEYYNPW